MAQQNRKNMKERGEEPLDPLVFAIKSKHIKDVWLNTENTIEDGINDDSLVGLIFFLSEIDLAGVKREPQVLKAGQLHIVDDTPIVSELKEGNVVKNNSVTRRIATSASSTNSSADTNPNTIDSDFLYRGLEFYEDTDLEVGDERLTKRDFIFFPAVLILKMCKEFGVLALSGAKVDYGSMMEIPAGDSYDPTSEYFTMKLEGISGDGAKAGPYPGISLGTVCPPKWYTAD